MVGWVQQLSGCSSDGTCLSKAPLCDSADIAVSRWFRGADTKAFSFFCLSCAGRVAAHRISGAAGGQEVTTFLFQLESRNCSLANSKWGMAIAAAGVENGGSEWSHLISLHCRLARDTVSPYTASRRTVSCPRRGCDRLLVQVTKGDCPLTTDKFQATERCTWVTRAPELALVSYRLSFAKSL